MNRTKTPDSQKAFLPEENLVQNSFITTIINTSFYNIFEELQNGTRIFWTKILFSIPGSRDK